MMYDFHYLRIRSNISIALHSPSTWLFNQLIASYETNVNDGKLGIFAKKLTPLTGCRNASNSSFSVAVALSFVSVKNVSSLSSFVITRLGSGFSEIDDVSDTTHALLLLVRSNTLLPDLQYFIIKKFYKYLFDRLKWQNSLE